MSFLTSPAELRRASAAQIITPERKEEQLRSQIERAAEVYERILLNPEVVFLRPKEGHPIQAYAATIRDVLRLVPKDANDADYQEINFQKYDQETVNQFLDWQYGKGLPPKTKEPIPLSDEGLPIDALGFCLPKRSSPPEIFDPMPLFQMAVDLGHEELKKELIFSRIHSNNRMDLHFLLQALTSDSVKFSKEELTLVHRFIMNYRWTDSVDDFVIALWKDRTEHKNALAHLFLAQCYAGEFGVKINNDLSFFHCKEAEKLGELLATTLIGACYRFGRGVKQDDSVAFAYFNEAAPHCPIAQAFLGQAYRSGKGVDKNLDLAASYLESSAHLGDPMGQTYLGFMYENTNTKFWRRPEESAKLYRLSAEQGGVYGLYYLGICYAQGYGVEKNLFEAVKYYRLAARQRHSLAMMELGLCYENGHGVEKSAEEAFRWYQEAAKWGSARALTKIGYCYETGFGVERDLTQAIRYYNGAENNGNNDALGYLGDCLFRGKGIEKDTKKGIEYISLSVKKGSGIGRLKMAHIYKESGSSKQAFDMYELAANQSIAEAQEALGDCYEHGIGTLIDLDKAKMCYRAAVANGRLEAREALHRLGEE